MIKSQMKRKFNIALAIGAIAISMSSCTKFYKCECTDFKGGVNVYTINAKTKIEANKNCAELQTLGNCVLK